MHEPLRHPVYRNEDAFYNALEIALPVALRPEHLARIVACDTLAGSFAFWHIDELITDIGNGDEDSLEDDVRRALEKWLQHARWVLINDYHLPDEMVRALAFANLEPLILMLCKIVRRPIRIERLALDVISHVRGGLF